MKNKWILFIVLLSIIIFSLVFLIFYYKNINIGNNINNKSEEKIIDNILNMKSYDALMNIKITTNKNETNYVVYQRVENKKSYQEIKEPKNIAGVTTEFDGINLIIKNNKLELETTFKDYQYIVENRLWLNSFIEEYKQGNNSSLEKNENEIILQVKRTDNPYNVIKKLFIDKKTGRPSKLTIQDINQKILVYILYTEIKIS